MTKDSLPPRTVMIDAGKMWSMITATPDPNKLFLVIFSLNSFGWCFNKKASGPLKF